MTKPPSTWPTHHVEFILVCEEDEGAKRYRAPVSAGVQSLLEEMLGRTLAAFNDDEMREYEFAESYGTIASLQKSLQHVELETVQSLATLATEEIKSAAVDAFDSIEFYLVRFFKEDGTCIVGVRRASYFRAVLKQRSRLLRMLDDTLVNFEDRLFKLDLDFDFVITATDAYILRPGNFESIAGIEDAIAGKIPDKVKHVQEKVPFLDFALVGEQAVQKKRVARLLASVASRDDLASLDQDRFLALATQTHVELQFKDGKYVPAPESVRGLLEILDRRRYHIDLSAAEAGGQAFVAGSRQAVSKK